MNPYRAKSIRQLESTGNVSDNEMRSNRLREHFIKNIFHSTLYQFSVQKKKKKNPHFILMQRMYFKTLIWSRDIGEG